MRNGEDIKTLEESLADLGMGLTEEGIGGITILGDGEEWEYENNDQRQFEIGKKSVAERKMKEFLHFVDEKEPGEGWIVRKDKSGIYTVYMLIYIMEHFHDEILKWASETDAEAKEEYDSEFGGVNSEDSKKIIKEATEEAVAEGWVAMIRVLKKYDLTLPTHKRDGVVADMAEILGKDLNFGGK